MMFTNYYIFLYPIGAYLLGSISSAILLSRFYHLPDPRTMGSKNPGTANLLRSGQVKIALMVFLFDLLKGMLPVWVAYRMGFPLFLVSMTAIAACIGHAYPIFFRFKGGKAVATALGAVAPIGFDLSMLMIVTWLLALLLTGYASLASVIAAVAAPLFIWWFRPEYTFAVSMLSCLIIWRHHENLERLWRHQEPKLFKGWRH